MRKGTYFIRKYPFSMLCIATVWVLSLVPFFPETPFSHVKFIDKWTHFLMYGGTCSVIWLEYLRNHKVADAEKLFFYAWLAPTLMGGLLELLQAYCTTTRSGEWLDFAANATGVTLAAIAGSIATYCYYHKR